MTSETMPMMADHDDPTIHDDGNLDNNGEGGDEALLREAAAGSDAALEVLLKRVAPILRSQLQNKIDNRWNSVLDLDDILQETYLDVFVSIGDFEPRGMPAFISWVSTIAQRTVIDAVRELNTAKQGGGRLTLPSQMGDGDSYNHLFSRIGGEGTSPSLKAARREAKTVIETLIRKLPPDYQQVLTQYDIHGRTADEVATACGCNVGAMHMRRLRAIKLLKSMIRSQSDLAD